MRRLYRFFGMEHPEERRERAVQEVAERAYDAAVESKALESEWNSLVESWRREGFPIADAVKAERHARRTAPSAH